MTSGYNQNLLGKARGKTPISTIYNETLNYMRPTKSSKIRAANVTQNNNQQNNQQIKAKESCFEMDKLKSE